MKFPQNENDDNDDDECKFRFPVLVRKSELLTESSPIGMSSEEIRENKGDENEYWQQQRTLYVDDDDSTSNQNSCTSTSSSSVRANTTTRSLNQERKQKLRIDLLNPTYLIDSLVIKNKLSPAKLFNSSSLSSSSSSPRSNANSMATNENKLQSPLFVLREPPTASAPGSVKSNACKSERSTLYVRGKQIVKNYYYYRRGLY